MKAAGDAVEAALKKNGIEVVEKVELNGLASDAAIIRNGAAQAADTFQAKGADTVFNVQSLTQVGAMYDEMVKSEHQLQGVLRRRSGQHVRGQRRRPRAASMKGMTCVTIWDTKATPTKDGLKPDNKLEASCRKAFDTGTGKTTQPGGPSGGITINGKFYQEDISPMECTMANLLLPAIKKAGKTVTWDKVYKNMMATDGAGRRRTCPAARVGSARTSPTGRTRFT